MPKYSREIVAEVLAANDIVDIIGRNLELKRAGGARFKALCPFHNEKTPSFHIDQHRQMFHCFGCGKGGDALAFLMEHEGLSFVEALQQLADRAAIRLPQPDNSNPDQQDLRAEVLALNLAACAFFRRNLAHPDTGAPGRAYLESRKLKDETIERFQLGYAPEGYTNLVDAAKQRHKERIIELSGLCKRGDRGSLYDVFRNRLIVPIKDVSGKVVAFGGRDLGDSPAKYINSPETVVYKKSRTIFALFDARDAMRKQGYALMMEGYFDVMRCFDAGVDHAIATCGTALTPEQAQLLKRYVPEVVLVYDGDQAGIQAALKGVGILVHAGLRVRVATLPGGQDPDDFIQNRGPEAFLQVVAEAPGFVKFYVEASRERLATVEGKTAVANELFAIIRQMNDALRVEEYLKLVSDALSIHLWDCKRAYNGAIRNVPVARPRPADEEKTEAFSVDDCMLLAAMLHQEEHYEALEEKLAQVELPESALGEILSGFRVQGIRGGVQVHGLSPEARRLWTAACTWPEDPSKNADALVSGWFSRRQKNQARKHSESILSELQSQTSDLDEQQELLWRLRQSRHGAL